MKDKTILVTGATGKQGGAVARHLLKAGFPVKAMTRNKNSESAQELHRQGAEVVVADLADQASLGPALVGVDGVFSVQNFWAKGVGFAGEVQQGKNLADAAKQAGVSHFVQSTMSEADSFEGVEHFQSKQEIEKYIDQIQLPRTFIGTVYFMDNMLDPDMGGPMSFPVLAGSLRRDTMFQMMAVDDLGGVVTAVFQQPDHFIGQRIDVAGDCLTVPEMKTIYRQVTGKRPKFYSIPAWMMRFMNYEFAAQLKWHNDVGWTFGSEQAKSVYPDMTDFAQFLCQHKITNL